ncbi:MAG: MCE family protein [Sciscionella sp.]
MRGKKALTLGALLTASSTLIAGCGFSGLYSLPLPGGPDVGAHPVTLHALMKNVYDLVPQESVKLNDVPIGKVTAIKLGHGPGGKWMANVVMQINDSAKLPANATAELRQTSLLGEKFVELVVPKQPQGTLANNATVQENDTYHHAEIEEVLGALSLLLNNGGLQQIQSISHELQNATSGNEQSIRTTLENVNQLATGLDAHSSDITKALDGLNRLSSTLNGQKAQIANVIDNIGPGLQSLNQQRDQLVNMLHALQNLSGVTIDTINASQQDLVSDLKALTPTLRQLAKSGKDLPNSLQLLLTPPFTDYAASTFTGDYDNLYATLDLNLGDIITNLGRSRQNPLGQSLNVPGLQGLLGGNKGSSGTQAQPQQQSAAPGGTPSTQGGGAAPGGGGGFKGLFGLLSGGGAG